MVPIHQPDTVGLIPMTSPFSNGFPMVFLWIYGEAPEIISKPMV